jgi:hypothetical protein
MVGLESRSRVGAFTFSLSRCDDKEMVESGSREDCPISPTPPEIWALLSAIADRMATRSWMTSRGDSDMVIQES